MSLSWGSHPPEPVNPPNRGFPTWLIALIGAVSLAVGVGLSVFTQAGPSNDEAARTAIEELLTQREDALANRDLEAYMRTVDPARVFLRSCEQQRFEAHVRLRVPPDRVTLGRIDKWGDYLRVWLDTSSGLTRAFARNDGARWYLSEPTSNELGEDLTKEFSGVAVHYRAVEEDLVAAIGDELPSIIRIVSERAPSPPSRLFSVRIATLTSTNGRCWIAGQAEGYGLTTITLNDVRLTPGYNHMHRETSATLEHEALHWVQIDHSAVAMRAMDWWLVEGWPYLIANTPGLEARRYAVCGQVPRYETLRFGPIGDTQPEDAERAYIVASLLVERTAKNNDREYWRVFDAFGSEATGDPFMRTLGFDGRALYDAWLADARRLYC